MIQDKRDTRPIGSIMGAPRQTVAAELAERRYLFRLYPTAEQAEVLHRHRRMVAELWNALLQRCEDIRRRTVQRQVWHDAEGKRHVGASLHRPDWVSQRKRDGEVVVMQPGDNGLPRAFTAYDMQNEVTYLFNVIPEYREMSIWCGHRTAHLLDRAFQAFYRRAREGAEGRAGYPRFKRTDRHEGIPHRSMSGCALRKDDQHERSWGLRLKGVPGTIHARGFLPAEVERWTDADVLWRDGKWSLSIACRIAARRDPGHRPVVIRFDLIDDFVRVNGRAETPDGLVEARLIQDRCDEMRSAFDLRWPRGRRRTEEEQREFMEDRAEISRLAARAARVRKNALHVWTCRIVSQASEITIHAPPVRQNTRTPRGDEKSWGANVEPVSELNRSTLAQAPATTMQMLKYKSEESGIRCEVVEDRAPNIAVGGDLVSAGKTLRRLRRETRKVA